MGVAAGAGAALLAMDDRDGDGWAFGDGTAATMVAAAEVLYPSELDGVEEFVQTYLRGVANDEGDRTTGIRDAAGHLDEWSRSWHDEQFSTLAPEERDAALRRIGADEADADPDGTAAERVRYHVVDELLFALYTSPTGGELLGIENPPGHPGGTGSYRRGP
jgi:hypothetical protein